MSNEEAINDLSVLAERMDSKSNEIYVADISLESVETAIEALKEQNAGRWIPVTERLPKLGEKVLVSTKHTVFTQVFKCIYGTPNRWWWEHNAIKEVTAWIPLPKPYKEGAEE